MFIDEKQASSLAKFLAQFNITIVDTCSIMEEGFLNFADNLSNAKDYLKKENEIIVFKKCVKELKKHSKDSKNDVRRIDAVRGLKVLKQLKRNFLIKFKNAKGNKNFADNVIYTYVSTHRISKTILVITQDKNLCQDLKNLNKSLSQGGRPIEVDIVSSDGSLKENFGRPDGYVSKANIFQKDRKIDKKPLRYPLPEAKKEETKTQKIQTKLKKTNPLIDEILDADKKLSANLNNSTVKRFEKIESIHDQLDRINKLKEKEISSIKLLVDKSKLQSTLTTLEDQGKSEKKIVEKKSQKSTSKVAKTESKVDAKKSDKNVEKHAKTHEIKSKKSTKKVETDKIKDEPKKATSKSKTKKKKVTLEEAQSFETTLNAKIFNPTYSKENKIKDLETFLEMVNSLKKADAAKLKMNSSFIKNKIDELKK